MTDPYKEKEKWKGTCSICKKEKQQLATVKVSTGYCLNYTIIKSCDSCRQTLHEVIEAMLRALWK